MKKSRAMTHLYAQLEAQGFDAETAGPDLKRSKLSDAHLSHVCGGNWQPAPITFYEFYQSQPGGGTSFERWQGNLEQTQ